MNSGSPQPLLETNGNLNEEGNERLRRIVPLQTAAIPASFETRDLSRGSGDGEPQQARANPDALPGRIQDLRNGYTGRIWEKIADNRYYPRMARRRGLEGEPVVEFSLSRTGNLMDVRIVQPSSYSILDRAAVTAVEEASPFPPIPEGLNMKSIRFKLPISFILEQQ